MGLAQHGICSSPSGDPNMPSGLRTTEADKEDEDEDVRMTAKAGCSNLGVCLLTQWARPDTNSTQRPGGAPSPAGSTPCAAELPTSIVQPGHPRLYDPHPSLPSTLSQSSRPAPFVSGGHNTGDLTGARPAPEELKTIQTPGSHSPRFSFHWFQAGSRHS